MTAIQWTNSTWNPVVGCRRVSPGCEHCYAETMAGRLARMGQRRYLDVVKVDAAGQPRGRWNGEFREVPEVLAAPLKWRRPRRVFVNSMSDLFGEGVSDEWIAAVHGVMAATPQHTYQILTKRPERAARWYEWIADPSRGARLRPGGAAEACFWEASERIPAPSGYAEDTHPGLDKALPPWPLRNVWLGVSVEDQQRADERIPYLLRCPAAVRFLSVEPMLGPIDLTEWIGACPTCGVIGWPMLQAPTEMDDPIQGALRQTVCRRCNHRFYHERIHWVIVGGESGPGARPCHVEWIRSIVRQCRAAAVPVFVKQLGSVAISDSDDDRRFAGDMTLPHPFRIHLSDRKGGDPSEWPEDLRVREWPQVAP